MGQPHQAWPDQRYLIVPLILLVPLAVIELVLILPRTLPWFCDQGHPFRGVLLPLLVAGLAVMMAIQLVLLVAVQAVLWRFVNAIWYRERAEADAAFASTTEMSVHAQSVPQTSGEPAAFFIEWLPGERVQLATFDVYVDDQAVWTVTGERLTQMFAPEGRHRVFIKLNHMKSDVVEMDLVAGIYRHLVCGMKPLIQNRFFRFFEKKLKFVAIPVALVCFFIPAAMRFLQEHLAVEFMAIVFLGLLGFYAKASPAFLPPTGSYGLSRGDACLPGGGVMVTRYRRRAVAGFASGSSGCKIFQCLLLSVWTSLRMNTVWGGDHQQDMEHKDGSSHSPLVPSQPSAGPGYLLGWPGRRGSTCTILEMWACLFAGRVRAVFLNSAAWNLMASRDRPSEENPSSGRASGIFRFGRSRRFSGLRGWCSGKIEADRTQGKRKVAKTNPPLPKWDCHKSYFGSALNRFESLGGLKKQSHPLRLRPVRSRVSPPRSPDEMPCNERQPGKGTETANRPKQSHRITTQLLFAAGAGVFLLRDGNRS